MPRVIASAMCIAQHGATRGAPTTRHGRRLQLRAATAPQSDARSLDRAERVLYHQILPLKLASDVGAEVVSIILIWRGRRRLGLALHFLPPVVASALLTRRTADLERLRDSPAGQYIAREMTPARVLVRLAGDAITVLGAWSRRPAILAVGAVVVVLNAKLVPPSGRWVRHQRAASAVRGPTRRIGRPQSSRRA
jgi:hypothetical protein